MLIREQQGQPHQATSHCTPTQNICSTASSHWSW
jgi:hypothetical protein